MKDVIKNPDDLIAAYPYQFEGENIGIVVLRGWITIFSNLCTAIDDLLGADKRGFHWVQTKAKFGVARFYYAIESDAAGIIKISVQQPDGTLKVVSKSESTDPVVAAIDELIEKVQDLTLQTCVECGAPGTMDDSSGKYQVLCNKHGTSGSNQPTHARIDIRPKLSAVHVGDQNEWKAPRRGQGALVLYLDYDGVLHHENCLWHPRRGPYLKAPPGHTLFQHAPLLSELLEPYPTIKIVLSTSWVRQYGFTGTAKKLPTALSERCIGATWHSKNRFLEHEWASAPRGMQIWGDVVRRHPRAWLAIDDDYLGWPRWAMDDNYVRTDEVDGISHPAVLKLLKEKLAWLAAQRDEGAT
jgi:hypothetical protein